ncbi:uncharacterized protein LOC106156310 [Lingula anatina]|uniref:Uncharacterized protein LOC106156310 n=1 Tax=Lingula anatina TaxID=7574 RepID=A0A1S3HPJ6_LINAN|nr:uncharacterized protein LOC106156310 [Lingula anatina]|eukprot:XP_013386959.1 uncharacterized protein LOC106156310 [Lingula anatina]
MILVTVDTFSHISTGIAVLGLSLNAVFLFSLICSRIYCKLKRHPLLYNLIFVLTFSCYVLLGTSFILHVLRGYLSDEEKHLCRIAGFLGTFSAQIILWLVPTSTSLLFISPSSQNEKMHIYNYCIIIVTITIFSATVTALPYMGLPYFESSYDATAIPCSPLQLPHEKGWEYAVIVLSISWISIFTGLCFAIAAIAKLTIKNNRVQKYNVAKLRTIPSNKEMAVKVLLPVAANLICWTIILTVLTLSFIGDYNINDAQELCIFGLCVSLTTVLHPCASLSSMKCCCGRVTQRQEDAPFELEDMQVLSINKKNGPSKFKVKWLQGDEGLVKQGTVKLYPPHLRDKWTTEKAVYDRLVLSEHENLAPCLWRANHFHFPSDIESVDYNWMQKESRIICQPYFHLARLYDFLQHHGHAVTEVVLHNLTADISRGLAHLHELGIVHNNLTTKTIFVQGSLQTKSLQAIIGDFENATVMKMPKFHKKAIREMDSNPFKADMKALGLIIFEMLGVLNHQTPSVTHSATGVTKSNQKNKPLSKNRTKKLPDIVTSTLHPGSHSKGRIGRTRKRTLPEVPSHKKEKVQNLYSIDEDDDATKYNQLATNYNKNMEGNQQTLPKEHFQSSYKLCYDTLSIASVDSIQSRDSQMTTQLSTARDPNYVEPKSSRTSGHGIRPKRKLPLLPRLQEAPEAASAFIPTQLHTNLQNENLPIKSKFTSFTNAEVHTACATGQHQPRSKKDCQPQFVKKQTSLITSGFDTAEMQNGKGIRSTNPHLCSIHISISTNAATTPEDSAEKRNSSTSQESTCSHDSGVVLRPEGLPLGTRPGMYFKNEPRTRKGIYTQPLRSMGESHSILSGFIQKQKARHKTVRPNVKLSSSSAENGNVPKNRYSVVSTDSGISYGHSTIPSPFSQRHSMATDSDSVFGSQQSLHGGRNIDTGQFALTNSDLSSVNCYEMKKIPSSSKSASLSQYKKHNRSESNHNIHTSEKSDVKPQPWCSRESPRSRSESTSSRYHESPYLPVSPPDSFYTSREDLYVRISDVQSLKHNIILNDSDDKFNNPDADKQNTTQTGSKSLADPIAERYDLPVHLKGVNTEQPVYSTPSAMSKSNYASSKPLPGNRPGKHQALSLETDTDGKSSLSEKRLIPPKSPLTEEYLRKQRILPKLNSLGQDNIKDDETDFCWDDTYEDFALPHQRKVSGHLVSNNKAPQRSLVDRVIDTQECNVKPPKVTQLRDSDTESVSSLISDANLIIQKMKSSNTSVKTGLSNLEEGYESDTLETIYLPGQESTGGYKNDSKPHLGNRQKLNRSVTFCWDETKSANRKVKLKNLKRPVGKKNMEPLASGNLSKNYAKFFPAKPAIPTQHLHAMKSTGQLGIYGTQLLALCEECWESSPPSDVVAGKLQQSSQDY